MGIGWGALHLYGRVIELNHTCRWLPGWCNSSLDMQRQMGSHEANFLLSQEAKGPANAKALRCKGVSFQEKHGTLNQSCRWRGWVERQAQIVLHLEMGLCLGTLESHQKVVSTKFTFWKDSSSWMTDNGLERCKPGSQHGLWQKPKHEMVGG